jgi:hypothetical protein
MSSPTMTSRALILATVVAAALCPGLLSAAGMTTHAFMADTGRQYLPEGPLKQILTVYRPSLIAGAIYPDGGYGSSAAFPADRDMAEHAHWGEFHLAFIDYLRERGCAEQARTRLIPSPLPGGIINNPVGTLDLAGLTEECGQLIAFAFGTAAHGITDETWDAQFEPEALRRGEDPNFAHWFGAEGFWGPIAPESPLRQIFGDQYDNLGAAWAATPMNAIEYAMDVIAIIEHNLQLNSPLLVFPPADQLIAVYARSGRDNITREQIERGNAFSRGAVQLQAATAHLDYYRVRSHMPWSANNYYLNAGGVVSSGRVVAAMYQNMWERLLAGPQAPLVPRIAGHYPEHGQAGVVLEPAQGRSWTQHRWMHVFMDAEIDPAAIEAPGAFALYDEAGDRVPVTVQGGHGWSRHWSHSTRIRLDGPLKPDHRYTAVLTPKVKDWSGIPLARPYVWEFVTAAE